GLQHGTAETAFQRSLFDGDDDVGFLDGPQHASFVKRLAEAGVDDTNVQPLGPQLFHCFPARWEQGAEREDDGVGTPLDDLGLAEFYLRRSAFDLFEAGLRIAHRDRARRVAYSEAEHRRDVQFVAGGHD